jgi:hypothetical protein
MKKLLIVVAILGLVGIGLFCFLRDSNETLVQRIDHLKNQKLDTINMSWYEQELLRRRLVRRGYLVEKIFDMPNTRMETPKSKELWDAMLTFRDTECSPVATFGMGPANGSTSVLYVTVTDLPSRIPRWKTMLLKWDSGAAQTRDSQKEGPESKPTK